MIADTTKTVTVYGYNQFTGEYERSYEYEWIAGTGLPANTTLDAPLEPGSYQVSAFDGKQWNLIPDFRGFTVYCVNTREPRIVDYIGPIRQNETMVTPSSKYVKWDGFNWVDPRTPSEIREHEMAMMPDLSRRQFKLALLDRGLLDSITDVIAGIQDQTLKTRILIEYSESTVFKRNSPSVIYMCSLFGFNETQIDDFWQYAVTL